MLFRLARILIPVLAVLAAGAPPAKANDIADFNAAAERVESHNRVALGYLRSGNVDLASIELDRLRAAWAAMMQQFAGRRPQVFNTELYTMATTDISMRLVTADMMINSGRLEVARQSLDAIRADFYKLRKAAGIEVLADCVRDANAAMDKLMAYDTKIDWNAPQTGLGLSGAAEAYEKVLGRCDAIAPEDVRQSGEFRRLVDGARASMKFIPRATAEHDTDLLHRVLIELRSFDSLLTFRFG